MMRKFCRVWGNPCAIDIARMVYLKSPGAKICIKETIESELSHLSVVSDYIQFNFERLDDWEKTYQTKLIWKQNHIFKSHPDQSCLEDFIACYPLSSLLKLNYNFKQIGGSGRKLYILRSASHYATENFNHPCPIAFCICLGECSAFERGRKEKETKWNCSHSHAQL